MPQSYSKIFLYPYITRRDFAMLLSAELPEIGEWDGEIKDVSRSSVYDYYIRKTIKYRIMRVMPDGYFYPYDKIKRKHLAVMVMRMSSYINIFPFGNADYNYMDIDKDDYFYKGAAIIGRYGLLKVDTMFYPEKYLSGNEAIYFVYMLKHWMQTIP